MFCHFLNLRTAQPTSQPTSQMSYYQVIRVTSKFCDASQVRHCEHARICLVNCVISNSCETFLVCLFHRMCELASLLAFLWQDVIFTVSCTFSRFVCCIASASVLAFICEFASYLLFSYPPPCGSNVHAQAVWYSASLFALISHV